MEPDADAMQPIHGEKPMPKTIRRSVLALSIDDPQLEAFKQVNTLSRLIPSQKRIKKLPTKPASLLLAQAAAVPDSSGNWAF